MRIDYTSILTFFHRKAAKAQSFRKGKFDELTDRACNEKNFAPLSVLGGFAVKGFKVQ
jgi:hypothetical protein